MNKNMEQINYKTFSNFFISIKDIEDKGITFINNEKINYFSYKTVFNKVLIALNNLQLNGIKAGNELIINLNNNSDFIFIFWACILGGIIPVPISIGNSDEHTRKLIKIRSILNNPKIIINKKTILNFEVYFKKNNNSDLFKKIKNETIFIEDFSSNKKSKNIVEANSSSIMFIQFSSGSTGDPKGVILTHENLITNVKAIINCAKITKNDSMISWLPLTHDMGLIGCHIVPLFAGINHHILSTSLFIRNPGNWIKSISKYKSTLISSPNFGLQYTLRLLESKKFENLDLSNVRIFFNGAEPISVELFKKFLNFFSQYGLKKTSMFPVYGMAEASLAVTFPLPDEEFKYITLDREKFQKNIIKVPDDSCSKIIKFANLGFPIDDCYIRIVDENNNELEENKIGQIQIKGKNVTKGYYNNKEITDKAILKEGWLNTGDIGFINNRCLFVTGRIKDIIFVNGQNYYSHDIERIIDESKIIKSGDAVVCGYFNQNTEKEDVLLFIRYKLDTKNFITIAEELKKYIFNNIGIYIDTAVPVKIIPKTTSGKLQRYKLINKFINGEFDEEIKQINYILSSIKKDSNETIGNITEEKLIKIWEEVLGIDGININDNFFDLGGHSLKAVVFVSKIKNIYNIDLPLVELIKNPDIKSIVKYLNRSINKVDKLPHAELNPDNKYLPFPLTDIQQAYLLGRSGVFELGNVATHAYTEINYSDLDLEKYTNVFNTLIKRHDMLRCIIFPDNTQKILEKVPEYKIDSLDLRDKSPDEIQKEINNIRSLMSHQLMKTDRWPLFEIRATYLSNNIIRIHLSIDLLIADAWSLKILFSELSRLYNNPDIKLNNIDLSFRDYIYGINKIEKLSLYKKSEKYWKKQIEKLPPAPELPLAKDPGQILNPKFKRWSYSLESEKWIKLKNNARLLGITDTVILLSAFAEVLSLYSRKQDHTLNLTFFNRIPIHKQVNDLIGDFTSTVLLEINNSITENFSLRIKKIQKKLWENIDHRYYSGIKVIRDLGNYNGTGFRASMPVVFTSMLGFEQNDDSNLLKNLINDDLYSISQTPQVWLDHQVLEENGSLYFNWDVVEELFPEGLIEEIFSVYCEFLHDLADDIKLLDEKSPLLKKNKKYKILSASRENEEKTSDEMLHTLFDKKVKENPKQIAVISKEKILTYKELDHIAVCLSHKLNKNNVQPNELVAVVMDKGWEEIAGSLGVLKSGGAYLPIDVKLPAERIKYLLKNGKVKSVLTQPGFKKNIDWPDTVNVIIVNDKILNEEKVSPLEYKQSKEDLAYVIYTSGSTGKPKGVMIDHKGVVNTILDINERFNVNNNDRVIALSSLGFDLSVYDIFGMLSSGGTIVIPDNDKLKYPNYWLDLIKTENVTIWNTVPAFMNMLVEYAEGNLKRLPKSLRLVLMSGDWIPVDLSGRIKKLIDSIDVNSLGGATEASIWSIIYPIKEVEKSWTSIPYGKALKNQSFYVLNDKLEPCPTYVPGELYIGGAGLAKGYWEDPETTSSRFITHPVTKERIYKTGDIGRFLPDGNIEFMGREDFQVKIQGHRIELGEIETVLNNFEEINKCIVNIYEDNAGSKYLVAYIVEAKTELDKEKIIEKKFEKIKKYLRNKLPEYMIPKIYMKISELPINSNGKINRKALPIPNLNENKFIKYIKPTNEIEKKLAEIWKDVLKINKIGINDNFFDLGGNSLHVITIISHVNKIFNRNILISDLFANQTIKKFSKIIKNSHNNNFFKIKPIKNDKKYFPVTSPQKRMFLIQNNMETKAYNMSKIFKLYGVLSLERIKKAFLKLIKKYEILRTSFEFVEDNIFQIINDGMNFDVDFLDINKSSKNEKNIIKDFIQPFDLSKAPLFRVKIIKKKSDEHLMCIDMHHIIIDRISMGILIDEFIKAYNNEQLEPLRIQFKDYALWMNHEININRINKQKKYWINRFKDEIPVLNIPTDYPRPAVQSFEGNRLNFKLDNNLKVNIDKLCKDNDITLFMFLLSVYKILLSRYSNQEDLVVGSVISGRNHAEIENLVGMLVNTLAIRSKPEGEKRFTDYIKEIKDISIGMYDNQNYPFEDLVEQLGVKRNRSRNPIFDVMFIVNDMELRKLEMGNIEIQQYDTENLTSKFDLVLEIWENDKNIKYSIEYCTKLFKEETINRMGKHFEQIVKNVVLNANQKIKDIDLITLEEEIKILKDYNNTDVLYSEDKTIIDLFEEQVEKTPDNTAAVFENISLTYKELNVKANQIGRYLKNKGVKNEDIVGLMVDRSLEMIIGILGILKAGGAYLPVDPDYPDERKKFMLEESGIKAVLTKSNLTNNFIFDKEIIYIDDKSIFSKESLNLKKCNNPNDLCYVIYTSGTTGKPKGVMIEHKGIANLKYYFEKELEVNRTDNIIQFASISFDASVWEIFMTLLTGAALYILDDDIISDYLKFEKFLIDNKITIATLPPSYINNINPDKNYSLRKIVIAGSKSTHELVRKWENKVEYINAYGPTESTICATAWSSKKHKKCHYIPIGKPIYNTQIYILDKYNKPVPIGISGELCIAGVGLARGYLNRESLTNEKFAPNPFYQGMKMYHTGDFARWSEDGNIEFFGRRDQQVKIRGFRIELGEIESIINEHENVYDNIVIVREDNNGEKDLVAYIVPQIDNDIIEINKSEDVLNLKIKSYLVSRLPKYMIPSYIVQIDKIPLTANGKADRKSLPDPVTLVKEKSEYEEPGNKIELKLKQIWEEVLGIKKIGINDNFFELGGHSLKAINLASQIKKIFNIEISVSELFNNQTIKELSVVIMNSSYIEFRKIKAAGKRDCYPVTSIQKRLYSLQRDMDITAYNMPVMFILLGDFDLVKLKNAFNEIIKKHESFRTSFNVIEGEVIQKIHNEVSFDINYIDLKKSTKTEKDIVKEFVRSFDLSKAPLLRVGVVKRKSNENLLMLDMHHIIADGASLAILIRDFAKAYNGEKLEVLNIQYKDYSVWQQDDIYLKKIKKQKKYWLDKFRDEIPVVNLPTDYPRPTRQSFEGNHLNFYLNEKLTESIHKICRNQNVTLYMFLFSMYNILLSKYSGQEDLVVGSGVSGRDHAELENIVGMFVNSLAVRSKPGGEKKFIDYLLEIKKISIEMYENQNYPFEDLVEEIIEERDLSRNPIFDSMFIVQNIELGRFEMGNIQILPYDEEKKSSMLDLFFNIKEIGKSIKYTIEYCTKLFSEDTIKRMGMHFEQLIKNTVIDLEKKIKDIDITTEEERERLINVFNNTKVDYPKNKTVVDLFEEQAARNPDNIAVVFKDTVLTYRELNEKSNKLANYLRKKGINSGSTVAICIDASMDTIIGILGILKNNCSYLAIDSTYPKDRIFYILQDAKISCILTNEKFLKILHGDGELEITVICLDRDFSEIEKENKDFQNDLPVKKDNIIYIVYTSGTTGNPKGVKGLEKGLLNRIYWGWEAYPFTKDEVCCHKTSLNFVDHVSEIFSPLLAGVPLVIFPDEVRKDFIQLVDRIMDKKITRIVLVPSLLNEILRLPEEKLLRLQHLKYVFCSGEALGFVLAKTFYQKMKSTVLVNIYGSSEVSADVIACKVDVWNEYNVLKYFRYKSQYNKVNSQTLKIVNIDDDEKSLFTIPNISLKEISERFRRKSILPNPISLDKYYENLYMNVIPYTIDTGSPQFIGHMTSLLPDYVHDLSKLISELNQNLVKIETSKSLLFLERETIAIMHRQFYNLSDNFYDEYMQKSGCNLGVVTTGGSTSNITALLSARNSRLFENVNHGIGNRKSIYTILKEKKYNDVVILGSRLMHYSIKKASSCLGLGTDNINTIDVDYNGKVIISDLRKKIIECRKNGLFILAIVGIAGGTETGHIDPLSEMGAIASEFDIHFHVDAAWGGAAIFSDEYRNKLKGIEKADSITLCGHKQMYLPQGISMCLFKNPEILKSSRVTANYQALPGSYDTGQFTIEGSRSALSLVWHAALHIIGKKGYELLINNGIDKTVYFANLIRFCDAFELINQPELNIINYRYIPYDLRKKAGRNLLNDKDNEIISNFNSKLQKEQFYRGKTFISKTTLFHTIYGKDIGISVLRGIISNPITSIIDIMEVLKDQLLIASELEGIDSCLNINTLSFFYNKNEMKKLSLPSFIKDDENNKNQYDNLNNRNISIGKPISNTQVYILDRYLKLVPAGVVGELYISGVNLSSGYLNNDELTSKSFIPNPFIQDGKMYKTGDLAKWKPDGTIEFLGRIDNQVKIRGMRIELEEIEAHINEHEKIKDNIVIAREDDKGEKYLVSYIVMEKDLEDKNKIKNVKEEQVSEWKYLFDDNYINNKETDDKTFNLVLWNSSYTGKAIEPEAMREWVDYTVDNILRYKPERVLEIGSGTGLLLFRIAQSCKEYLGTDFSSEAISYVNETLDMIDSKREIYKGVELREQEGCDFTGVNKNYYDLVIINSVVQYLPDLNYFIDVVKHAVKSVKKGGKIYIGDIRNLRLLETFHSSVILYGGIGTKSKEEIKEEIRRNISQETELIIAPVFFNALKERIPEISGVEIRHKRGKFENELTKYRYDVILHIKESPEKINATVRDWINDDLTIDKVKKILKEDQCKLIEIIGVPNSRLKKDIMDLEELKLDCENEEVIHIENYRGELPESFYALDCDKYEVSIHYGGEGREEYYNVVFMKKENDKYNGNIVLSFQQDDYKYKTNLLDYANNPIKTKIIGNIGVILRDYLKTRLPEYMIPSYIVHLDKIPLTANGKVNRKSLPDPRSVIGGKIKYIAPGTETEKKLVKIWEEVLGIDRIGVNDNFFYLGGHSLKAISLVSQINKTFNIGIEVSTIFSYQTLKEFAALVDNSSYIKYRKIEPVEKRDYYPVTSPQKRLYSLQRSIKATVYNMPGIFILKGELDINKLEEVFNEIIKKHEVFRTYFELKGEEVVQRILDNVEFKFEYINIKEQRESEKEILKEFIQVFDLRKAPLLRVKILKRNINEHIMMIDMHHIIADGTSMGILIQDFVKTYKGEKLESLRIQYKDYAVWQEHELYKEKLTKQREYWVSKFHDEIPVLNLPTDYPRPAVQSFEGNRLSFNLDEQLTRGIYNLCKKYDVTLYMFLFSVYSILLSKYISQEDILVGSGVSGRNHTDIEGVVGMFVNTLAVRSKPDGEKRFADYLSEIKDISIGMYENQDYPFEDLVEQLEIKRDVSRNPIFDAMFIVQNMDIGRLEMGDIEIQSYNMENLTSKFDLLLEVWENNESIKYNIEYCTKLFKEETIKRMGKHFEQIIRTVTLDVEKKIKDIDIITEEEKNKILYKFNDTTVSYPNDKTIVQLFEDQVIKIPDNIALLFNDKSLTYKELNEKSNQVGQLLREKGVGPDIVVGLMIGRSFEMIIGILGILKAGGAYLPIDPNYPKERRKYIINDSSINILLTLKKFNNINLPENIKKIILDSDDSSRGDMKNLGVIVNPNNIAYIIYTSGSTGNPKGTIINHKSLINRLNWHNKKFPIGRTDCILQKTPYTFDVSVWELLWWPISGSKLCFLNPGDEKNPQEIVKSINKNNISVMHFVPSMLGSFLEYLKSRNSDEIRKLYSLKYVITSGEALTPKHVKDFYNIFYECKVCLCNLYGPTEATIDVTYFDCIPGKDYKMIPIGKPIDNTQLYILNKYNELQPIGITGELCIGGLGVSMGYLNRPDLTKEKFVVNPYIPGDRVYRTGDLARWLEDGNIEFLGRIDNQVKIRGFRVELGEIENAMLNYNGIKEAVVKENIDNDKTQYLCGYIVGDKIDTDKLRYYLRTILPEYMIPSFFILLDKLPLNKNGKLDYKELPDPIDNIENKEIIPPNNQFEEALVNIWAEILGHKNIGITNNFFDIGGHSLKLIRAHEMILKIIDKEISIIDLFKYPTIKSLANFINNGNNENLLNRKEQINHGKLRVKKILKRRKGNSYDERN